MISKNLFIIFSSLAFTPIFATESKLYNRNIILNNNTEHLRDSKINNLAKNETQDTLKEEYSSDNNQIYYFEMEKSKEFRKKIAISYNKAFLETENLNKVKYYDEIIKHYIRSDIKNGRFDIFQLNEIKNLNLGIGEEINLMTSKINEIKKEITENPTRVDLYVKYYINYNLLILMKNAYYATYNAAPPYKFAENAKSAAAIYSNNSKADYARELRKKADAAYKLVDKAYKLYANADKKNKSEFFELRKRYYEAEDLARKLDDEADMAFNSIR
nr:hypothetical protein GTC16762_04060 [Pigmentibacter ruber]